jgi:glycolate oxidase iron-sulfur subunit
MEGARIEITAQRASQPRRLRHLLLDRVLPSRPLMRLATAAMAIGQRLRLDRVGPGVRLRGLRELAVRPPATVGIDDGTAGAPTAAILAGCVMDPWFGAVHEAAIALLRRAGWRVVVPRAQTCCGALAAHDGAAKAAHRLAATNVAAFADVDLVVVDAAGCSAHMKEYGQWADGGSELAGRVCDVTEVVADFIADGTLPSLPDRGVEVAMQDPCHLRHAQRITAQPRQIVAAAGYRVREIDARGLCCGAAGLYTLLEPATSAELGRQKAQQVRSTGATLVASANPGCEIQLRNHLGAGYRVAHPIELYLEALTEADDAQSSTA